MFSEKFSRTDNAHRTTDGRGPGFSVGRHSAAASMAHSDQPGLYVADGSEEFVSSMLEAVAVNEEKAVSKEKEQAEGTAICISC